MLLILLKFPSGLKSKSSHDLAPAYLSGCISYNPSPFFNSSHSNSCRTSHRPRWYSLNICAFSVPPSWETLSPDFLLPRSIFTLGSQFRCCFDLPS